MLQFVSKSQRASKSHNWFKSYGEFEEWVDFAYRWSFIGGGSAINGANPSSFSKHHPLPCLQRLESAASGIPIQSIVGALTLKEGDLIRFGVMFTVYRLNWNAV